MDNEIKLNLTKEEEKELQDGQYLYEMTQTPGFQVLVKKLEDLGFHSWVDPREAKDKEDFLWRELNGFHAANTAKELIMWIQERISNSDYLQKKKEGKIKVNSMRI